jgi:hypothetical protein
MDRFRCVTILTLAVLSVASMALPVRDDREHITKSGFDVRKVLRLDAPGWLDVPPKKMGYRFFVGETHGVARKEDALEKAWISAFVRIGMTQFPELTRIKTESTETLKDADYKRQFAMSLELVDWTGIAEATEYGSPYIREDEKTGEYSVYRLLKWTDADMERARKTIHAAKRHEIPGAPETLEPHLVDAVQKMKSVATTIAEKNSVLTKVFRQVRCGVKIADLRKILGKPDWQSPYDSEPRTYRWGTFHVEADNQNTFVVYVIPNNGSSIARNVCAR